MNNIYLIHGLKVGSNCSVFDKLLGSLYKCASIVNAVVLCKLTTRRVAFIYTSSFAMSNDANKDDYQ